MRTQTKKSADLSSRIASSDDAMFYDSDEEELEGASDNADSVEEDNEDMTEESLPSPETSFQYLELFDELCALFIAPRCLVIRSSYETLHKSLMTAAECGGEGLETVNCFALLSAATLPIKWLSLMAGAKLLVTGTPGVGKTCWIIYLLWKLANAGKTVILDMYEELFLFSRQAFHTVIA